MCFLLVLFGFLLYSESYDLVILSDCGAYHPATLNTTFTGKAREEIVIEQSYLADNVSLKTDTNN